MIVTIFTTISQKGDPVKISTKTRYGMRFMIDLAQSQGEGRVALKDIADRQGLSKKYLEQVVAPLASAGLLDVTRGNQGGYRLSCDASAITLADIVAASEDGLELLDCMGSLSACERAEDACERMGVEPTGFVAASDAFFPFRDGLDALAEAGVTAIIEPGGSIRDDNVIDTCNKYNMAMCFTGIRLFHH